MYVEFKVDNEAYFLPVKFAHISAGETVTLNLDVTTMEGWFLIPVKFVVLTYKKGKTKGEVTLTNSCGDSKKYSAFEIRICDSLFNLFAGRKRVE